MGGRPVTEREIDYRVAARRRSVPPARTASRRLVGHMETTARYRIGQQLASGGFGAVFEIECLDDGWTGVAKLLKEAENTRGLERFRREVRLQTQMSHPGIVRIRTMNLENSQPWFAMDRAEQNLRSFLQAGTKGEQLLPLFIEVARAIEYAHANGVIHRDIKPENILLFRESSGDLKPKVSDFGLGRHIDRTTLTLTQDAVMLGTMAYAAPEQMTDGHRVDARADVYSLGKLLYEILTGRVPFPTLDYAITPTRFRYLVQKATATDPEHRYSSVTALLTDLDVLTARATDLEFPEQTVLRICEKYSGPVPPPVNQTDFEVAFSAFVENQSDYSLLVRALPKLPPPFIGLAVTQMPDRFLELLRAYDSAISAGLTFEYCDVVADFYEQVFGMCDREPRIQALVLRRLATLGADNNRWHVGRAFARVLKRVRDPALLLELKDVFDANPGAAEWLRNYVSDVPAVLRPHLG